jgi:hypothetical protein
VPDPGLTCITDLPLVWIPDGGLSRWVVLVLGVINGPKRTCPPCICPTSKDLCPRLMCSTVDVR